MADIQLFVARDPLLLLERAADAFLRYLPGTPEAPLPSPPYLLALRQGGLRDDLMARAAERGVPGWFDPPLCVFRELPDYLGSTSREPLDDFERAVLLAAIVRRTPGEVFGRLRNPDDFVAALDALIGELVAEGTTPDAWRDALASRPGRDAFELERDAQLEAIYREYVAALTRDGRRDGRDTWLDCAAALAADPAALAVRLGGRREIRLVGLQDLRGGWSGLLRALGASPALDRIAIYTAEPLDLPAELGAVVTRLEEPETIATRLFGPAVSGPPRQGVTVSVVVAPDAEREVEEVARRVRALADCDVRLPRIAVVARQARPYVDLLVAALDRMGVPAYARRRTSLAEVPVVRALRALLRAAADEWARHALVELAEQPYFAVALDARVLNIVGYRSRILGLAAWGDGLQRLLADAKAEAARRAAGEPDRDDHRRPPPPVWRVERALAGFEAFARHAVALDGARPLLAWVRGLERLLEQDPWRLRERIYRVPPGRFELARIDLLAWDAVRRAISGWRAALERWGSPQAPIAIAAFVGRVDALLEGDVAFWTGNRRGVPVLEALAAAYRSFDHVFLVGLEAGRFPRRAPVSPILDDGDRSALAAAGVALEPREVWDARERELFRSVVACPRDALTVSYARLDAAGRDVIRSAFIDALEDVAGLTDAGEGGEIPASRVTTPGIRLWTDPAGREQALHAAGMEWERRHHDLGPYSGLIRDPELLAVLARDFGDDRLWSPTQLESYAKCPWAYFSARLLGLERLEEPDEEMDPATRGSILHDALRRFYERARMKQAEPVFLRATDRGWAVPAVAAALDEALAQASAERWVGHPALRGAKRAELLRILYDFLEAEVREHEDMYDSKKKNAPRMIRTAADSHEAEIREAVLQRDGVRVRFRGSIDRVEVGVDDRFDGSGAFTAAVDYKSSIYSTPGGGDKAAWEDGVVLQVPLYAHALAQLRTGTTVARVEYRSLRNPKPVHQLQLWQYDPATRRPTPGGEEAVRMEQALTQVIGHVRAIRAGKFQVRPPDSCKCSPYCHALDICRIPGGPTFKW